jgi:hypothetical protein
LSAKPLPDSQFSSNILRPLLLTELIHEVIIQK